MKRALLSTLALFTMTFSNYLQAQITFEDPVTYRLTGSSFSFSKIESADFNNDGFKDIAATVNDNLYLLINNGDGTFMPSQEVGYFYSQSALCVGDFNNDGLTDIVVGSQQPNFNIISILLNDPDNPGAFLFPATYSTGTESIVDLKAIDFNNDGNLDIVEAGRPGVLILLQNDGQGAFTIANSYSVGESPVKIVVKDLDADGFNDLVLKMQYPQNINNEIKIFRNNQDGNFTLSNIYLAGNGASDIAVEDINQDNNPDIIACSNSSGALFSLLNDGTGQFSVAIQIASIDQGSTLNCADFDGDRLKDLIVGSMQHQDLSIFINSPTTPGTFTVQHPIGSSTLFYPWRSVSEDFNNDKKPDLAIVEYQRPFASVYLNNSDWTLPVDLKDFKGSINNGTVRLDWNSGIEANFSHYEIEKSINEEPYIKIGSVEAKGSNQNYQFKITQPEKIVNYRLKLSNNDGSFSYSKVLNILNQTIKTFVKLWPNPSKNFINIQLNASGIFKIFDNSGKLIQSEEIRKGENKIDIRKLSTGVYYGLIGDSKFKFIKL